MAFWNSSGTFRIRLDRKSMHLLLEGEAGGLLFFRSIVHCKPRPTVIAHAGAPARHQTNAAGKKRRAVVEAARAADQASSCGDGAAPGRIRDRCSSGVPRLEEAMFGKAEAA
jgi:hypothetical protein